MDRYLSKDALIADQLDYRTNAPDPDANTIAVSALEWNRHVRACNDDPDGRALVSPLYLLANDLDDLALDRAADALRSFLDVDSETATQFAADALEAIRHNLAAWKPKTTSYASSASPDSLVLPRSLFGTRADVAASLAAVSSDSYWPARLLIDLYQPSLHRGEETVQSDAIRLEYPLITEWKEDDARLALFSQHAERFVAPVGPLVGHADGPFLGSSLAPQLREHGWRSFWRSVDRLHDAGLVEWQLSLREAGTEAEQATEHYRIRMDDSYRALGALSKTICQIGQRLLQRAQHSSDWMASLADECYALPIPPYAQEVRLVGVLRLAHGAAVWPTPEVSLDDDQGHEHFNWTNELTWLRDIQSS